MAARQSKGADNRPSSKPKTTPRERAAAMEAKRAAPLTPEQKQAQKVRAMLGKYQTQVQELLSGEDPTRFMRNVYRSLAMTPKLNGCTPTSLVGGMLEVATLNLELGTLGEAWLLPFWNGKARELEAQLLIGYRGYMKLARNTGQVGPIQALVVREADDFVYQIGTKVPIRHTPSTDVGGQKTAWIGAYALAYLKGFDVPQVHYMTAEQIVEIRENSQAYQNGYGPWIDHEESMWVKTPVRGIVKFLPLSAEAQHAVTLDGLADAGKSQQLGSSLSAFGIEAGEVEAAVDHDGSEAEHEEAAAG